MLDEQEPTAWSRAMAAHAASLVVGVRVMVSLGECVFNLHYPRLGAPSCRILWHVGAENKRTGTIAGIDERDSHRYVVGFDELVSTTITDQKTRMLLAVGCGSGRYAAAELVVLRAADPDEEGEG